MNPVTSLVLWHSSADKDEIKMAHAFLAFCTFIIYKSFHFCGLPLHELLLSSHNLFPNICFQISGFLSIPIQLITSSLSWFSNMPPTSAPESKLNSLPFPKNTIQHTNNLRVLQNIYRVSSILNLDAR